MLATIALVSLPFQAAWAEETTTEREEAGESASQGAHAEVPPPAPEAQGDERDVREDALFGASEEDDTAERERGLFDAEDTPGLLQEGLDIVTRVNAKDDLLQLGGQIYMRLDWNILAEGPPESFPLRAPGLLDLYVDVRPTDRLRAFASGRVSHRFTGADEGAAAYGGSTEATRVALDQLWLKFDIARYVFFTVGQQPIRWGHGRFWNPTDFLNRQFKDPLAVFDERLGVSLIKVHVPVESLGWNFYAIADIDGADSFEKIGGAVRAEFVVDTTELAVSFAARKDAPYRLGASVSSGFWWIDAWAEFALLHDVRTPQWEGAYDLATFSAPTQVDVSDSWWPRISAGFEIALPLFDEDTLYIGMEYAYNSLGYEDASLYPWLIANQSFVPLYAGKHYGAAYAALPAPGRWDDVTFILSQLSNLSDGSNILRFDTQLRVLTYLSLNVYASVHYGALGEFRFGQDIAPDANASAAWSALDAEAQAAIVEAYGLGTSEAVNELLENGIQSPAPVLDIGVGLRLRL
ncbi:MAG: hypothetical protein ACPGU1_04550 [Myxococcota bacterium]